MTALRLLVMRHGPAEDQSSTGRDFDRRLSEIGRQRVRRVAAELSAHGESPACIVSSPLVRARETAEIVRAVLGIGATIEEDDDLVPGGPALRVVRELQERGVKSALLVSHEPTTSHLAAQLLSGFSRSFETAMVLGVEVSPPKAKRCFLLEPSTMTWKLG